MYSRSCKDRWCRYYALRYVLMGVSGTLVIEHGSYRLSNNIADEFHPYIASLPNENESFQQDNAPCHEVRIVLEWFQEHNSEFQLMLWPSNSLDIKPFEYIFDVIEWRLRAQKPPCRNISDLCDSCLNNWYNLVSGHLPLTCGIHVAAILRNKVGQRIIW